MNAEDPKLDLSKYRPNVGIVVFNRDGLVWLGRRARTAGPYNWQFPQGGVDKGEDFETAARRELYEETGIRKVTPLGETDGWIVYDFPPDYGGSKAARGFIGQRQKWFAYRFDGDDIEVNLEAHHEIEFDGWRWAKLEDALDRIVPFKRASYAKVIEVFAPLVARAKAS